MDEETDTQRPSREGPNKDSVPLLGYVGGLFLL